MAKQTNNTDKEQEITSSCTFKVKNRNDFKVELLINGDIVVFPPHKVVEIPDDFQLPQNLGLYKVE